MNIEKFCKKYNLGKVLEIEKITGGLMHKMFKVETNIKTYAIKVLNPEVMSRKDAYNNFIVSEKISNLAKDNNISVSNALNINGNFINKYNDEYYMVFDFIEGKTLTDDEITINHCKKIGSILAKLHSLDYTKINVKEKNKNYNNIHDFESYINNKEFNKMTYKDKYLKNYIKYSSLQKRANERLNEANEYYAICHRDMDLKNVMWNNDNPIIIDFESASISNPYLELVETALNWSGFLSDNFDANKFKTVIEEYTKTKPFEHNRYNIICGGLISRFNWLKYNLDRSLGIITTNLDERKLAEDEVNKTIDEINRYQLLIGKMYKIICDLTKKENHEYDAVIEKIIESNDLLKGLSYKKIDAGFTNTIYKVENYIVKICTNTNNEDRFKNEIDFYNLNKNNDHIPKLYYYDISKNIVPYFYEIIGYIDGETIYDVWYKISDSKREELVIEIINILKQIYKKCEPNNDFFIMLESKMKFLKDSSKLDDKIFDRLMRLYHKYFKENIFSLIHGDLHFDNFIISNEKLYLIDFESCIIAPIDYDFFIFNRCKEEPWLWASGYTDMLTVESDYQNLMDMFFKNYKELNEIPYIEERLEIYSIIDLLERYKNTKNKAILNNINEKIRQCN